MNLSPDRNLAMELVRATEAAAIAAGRWMGRADKEAGDQAAVDAMRSMLTTVDIRGVVVIGEGEKDEAPMLFNGETVGSGYGPPTDIAVDPIDGTTMLAQGRPGALAVLAMAPRGTMFDPGPVMYMMKWVVGPNAVDRVDIDAPIADNLKAIADAEGKNVGDLTIVMLDRPRHEEMAAEVRAAGARLSMISDGDIAGALSAALPNGGADALIGIGGTPEGVVTACAMKAIGGHMLTRLYPRNDQERQAAIEQGYDLDKVLTTDDLVHSDDTVFVCTSITGGNFLEGVEYTGNGIRTTSLSMRSKSGTIRRIIADHSMAKLQQLQQLNAIR